MVEANASMQSTASTQSTASNGGQTSMENYSLGPVVGQGAYGKVQLATEIATGRSVAIKQVSKKQITELGKQRHIFRERDLLNEMDNPFIIKLLGTSQDDENLYFIFENCGNGDLADLIQLRRNLDNRLVKLFAAQIVHVLEYMQTKLIMHRDLKPQNLMLDDNFNIKFIDFGDAKKENEEPIEDEPQQNQESTGPGAGLADEMMQMNSQGGGAMDRRGTLVGTMNYLAPEMVQTQQAVLATDLWALGCIIFKMATGSVPFTGTQNYTVFPKINNREIEWPKQMEIEPTCRDLIDKLIVLDPLQRLGAEATGGMSALKAHPFFQSVDFANWDMTKIGMRRAVRETEPMWLRQKRYESAVDQTLPEFRYACVETGKPILTGLLLKKNRFYMKQERRFELYMDGVIKYFAATEQKGTMELTARARCRALNRTEVEIELPENDKNYLLLAQEPSKCPPKTQFFSCQLNDWEEAVNYVCRTLAAEQGF